MLSGVKAQSYTFSTNSKTYTPLSSDVSITKGLTWDDLEIEIPLGFNFMIYNTRLNKLNITGYFYGAGLTRDTVTDRAPLLMPFLGDFVDRKLDLLNGEGLTGGVSNISYKTEGALGSRIFKIQYSNIGFYEDLDNDGICQDSLNFQVWLYEGSNNVEYRYGTSQLSNLIEYSGYNGIAVGVFSEYDYNTDMFNGNSIVLTGRTNNPIAVNSMADTFAILYGKITANTVFKFEYINRVGIDVTENLKIATISPNPASAQIQIMLPENISQAIVIDLSGKEISVKLNNNTLDISSLAIGNYFIRYTYQNEIISQKFTKI